MKARDIIVIGTSAGGLSALKKLLSQLPPNLPATVFIVQHMSPAHSSNLPALLERAGNLKVSHPRDGERIVKSHIYVAPPDHHLIIEDGTVRLSQGPKENLTRPAIDPLFRSAALVFRSRVLNNVAVSRFTMILGLLAIAAGLTGAFSVTLPLLPGLLALIGLSIIVKSVLPKTR